MTVISNSWDTLQKDQNDVRTLDQIPSAKSTSRPTFSRFPKIIVNDYRSDVCTAEACLNVVRRPSIVIAPSYGALNNVVIVIIVFLIFLNYAFSSIDLEG